MTDNTRQEPQAKIIDLRRLAAHFPPDAISWRVGPVNNRESGKATKGIALAYLDARDVQDRLDAVCGPENWQVRHPWSVGNKLACEIGVRVDGEWIWKGDGAGESDMEAEKGAFSDSFKRAAVRFGIGRYLYDIDSPWVEIEPMGKSYKIKDSEKPKLRQVLVRAAGGAANTPATAPAESLRPKPVETQPPQQPAHNVDVPLILEDVQAAKTLPALDLWITDNTGMLAEIAQKAHGAYDTLAGGIVRHALTLCKTEAEVTRWVGGKHRDIVTKPMSQAPFDVLCDAVSHRKGELKANLRMAG